MLDIIPGNEFHQPIKTWIPVSEIEDSAIQQLKNLASVPGLVSHVAVMPDVHAGKGSTVGSVFATSGSVIPAAVGVDIGCGMVAVKTSVVMDDIADKLPAIRSEIEAAVPVGFQSHKEVSSVPDIMKSFESLHPKVQDLSQRALLQMGTLGGGNHFIEVCRDESNNVWVMLHSGSRHIGKALADIHIHQAKDLMKQYFITLPDPDLAYLVEGTPAFDAYLRDLHWAQQYAYQNRQIILLLTLQALSKTLGNRNFNLINQPINCHHNYVSREHHMGHNVWVTRKGAVRATQGEFGIIPGSMGAKSFIVRGKGCVESFMSCSHGAGRCMSRTKARASFTQEDLTKQTEGVECRKDLQVVDEIPGAYKSIDKVMKYQEELVDVEHTLKQVVCVKG